MASKTVNTLFPSHFARYNLESIFPLADRKRHIFISQHQKLLVFFSSTVERTYVAFVLRSTEENSFTKHSFTEQISPQHSSVSPFCMAEIVYRKKTAIEKHPTKSEHSGEKVAILFSQKSTLYPRIHKNMLREEEKRVRTAAHRL